MSQIGVDVPRRTVWGREYVLESDFTAVVGELANEVYRVNKDLREAWALIDDLRDRFDRTRAHLDTCTTERDLLADESDRLKDGNSELVREMTKLVAMVKTQRSALDAIADPEVYDLDARAMRLAALQGLAGQEVEV